MDEAAFGNARGTIAGPACVFERALLARCADCRNAARHALAEREAAGCRSPVAHTNCATLLQLVRERSTFALKIASTDAPLRHALAMRLQCGGLEGVAHAVAVDGANDVHTMVVDAQARYGALGSLPWPAIVAAVVGWQGRRRGGAP